MVHGDLTTSNVLLCTNKEGQEDLAVIDFGLSSWDRVGAEERAVDLYVLERALISSHPNMEPLFSLVLDAYGAAMSDDVAKSTIKKLEEVRLRGRKRTMVG
jgi:TP53 regulating kinase-like protein